LGWNVLSSDESVLSDPKVSSASCSLALFHVAVAAVWGWPTAAPNTHFFHVGVVLQYENFGDVEVSVPAAYAIRVVWHANVTEDAKICLPFVFPTLDFTKELISVCASLFPKNSLHSFLLSLFKSH
jgi:hypothetical protein